MELLVLPFQGAHGTTTSTLVLNSSWNSRGIAASAPVGAFPCSPSLLPPSQPGKGPRVFQACSFPSPNPDFLLIPSLSIGLAPVAVESLLILISGITPALFYSWELTLPSDLISSGIIPLSLISQPRGFPFPAQIPLFQQKRGWNNNISRNFQEQRDKTTPGGDSRGLEQPGEGEPIFPESCCCPESSLTR